MPSSPIQIRLATTDVNESATWTTKDGSNFFHVVDPLYAGLTYTEIQNPIPKTFDYYKSLPGVGSLRQNESAAASTGGGHFLGGTAAVVENAFSGTAVGSTNKVNIKNLVSQFMSARNQGGVTMSIILNGKQDELTQQKPPFTESDYVRGAAAGVLFNANTFYKTSNWISFHSKDAVTDTTTTPSLTSNAISFRKSFHHEFLPLNESTVAGISQDTSRVYVTAFNALNWDTVGLSANAVCTFCEFQQLSATAKSTNKPTIITCLNKQLRYLGASGPDAIFQPIGVPTPTPFNAAAQIAVSAKIAFGNAAYASGSLSPYSISTPSVVPLAIRQQNAISYGTKNFLGIALGLGSTRFFGISPSIGITVGSYIQISGASNASNNGIYQVLSIQDGVPGDTQEVITGNGLPVFQYLELSREIIPETNGSQITVRNVSNLPILHIKYTKVVS